MRPYHCEICGQTFVRQDLLKRHAKRTHGLEKGSRRKKARIELLSNQQSFPWPTVETLSNIGDSQINQDVVWLMKL